MPSQYEIPAFGLPADRLHPWLLEAVAESNLWLKAQQPTQEWSSIMDVLGSDYAGAGGNKLLNQSNTGYNRVRREYREIVATLSNFRHAGEFVPTEEDSQEWFDRAHMLSNLDEHWWRVSFAHLKIRDAMLYAVAKGTGYLYQDWDKSKWGPGRGDIRLRACDPAQVTFIQLPQTHDIQQAYVALIREELPLQLAKRMYSSNPAFANALVADRESPGWIQKGLERVQQFISPALRNAGSIRKRNDSFPTVDIWHAYTLDGSYNQGPQAVTMGVEGTNWSYRVPALGDPIPQGIRNPATGAEWTLSATPEDCLLFPLRRLTIFSRTGTAYDGSSPWWHGATPLARFRFNDLPWEALGASQVGDAVTMQEGIIAIMRSVEDRIAASLDPPAIYDDSRVDKAWADAVNPRKAGIRAAADLTNGSPITYPVPPDYYRIPENIIGQGGYIQQQEERMDYVTCARDLVAVAKARQIPSADTMEKLLEMAGPIVQDMVRALEEPLTQLGEWRKALYLQFYTRPRMIRIADPDATELLQDVKYVPDKLVPYIQGEDAMTRATRVRNFLTDFRYDVTQSGINELMRMSTKLLYLQLAKAGFPISWWTLAKICQIPNFGPPPKDTDTEMERWVAQKHMEAELQVELAEELQRAQMAGAGGPVSDQFVKPNGSAGGEGAGRPPEFKKPPRIVTKDSGARTTVTTS